MSRLKKNQNTNGLIEAINTVLKNRCSLSDEDYVLLNDVMAHLLQMKCKKGSTNEDLLETGVKVIVLLSEYFKK